MSDGSAMMTPEARPSIAGDPASGGRSSGRRTTVTPSAAMRSMNPGPKSSSSRPTSASAAGREPMTLSDLRALEQEQAVLLERHQLPELVDGRLDDLFEVEAGGRPRGDVVEQLRLARRLLLAREQRRVVDGERRGVADRRGRVQLGLS